MDSDDKGKDSRKYHRMLVLISCFLVMVLHVGFLFTVGTLFTDIMTSFNSSRAETAVIQSTALAVAYFSGIFVGVLINKVDLMMTGIIGSVVNSVAIMACVFASSLTYLIIAVGVFCGFGVTCVYLSSAAVVSQNFEGRKQFLFLSIHAVGGGVGGMVFPYIIRYLSDLYGFRGALLIIGAFDMNTIPACILWKRHISTDKLQEQSAFATQINEFETHLQVKTKVNGENITIEKMQQNSSEETSDSVYVSQYPVLREEMKTKTVTIQSVRNTPFYSNKSKMGQTACVKIKQILYNKCYMTFSLGMIILVPSLNLIIIFVADIFQDNGLSNSDVSFGMFLNNGMSTAGRLLPGLILQSKYTSLLTVPVFDAVLSATLILVFTFVKSRWLIILTFSVIGIPFGICYSIFSIMILELVGPDALPVALGMLLTLNGIGHVVTGPVSGYIRDVTGSYTAILYTSSGMSVLAAALFSIVFMMKRREKYHVKLRSSVFYLTRF